MKCKKCKNEIKKGAAFCGNCGTPVPGKGETVKIIACVFFIVAIIILSLGCVGLILSPDDGYETEIEESEETTEEVREETTEEVSVENTEETTEEAPEVVISEDPVDIEPSDIPDIINEAGLFTWSWFYDNTHTDKSVTIKGDVGGLELNHELVTEPGINSKEDVRQLALKYYTEETVDQLMSYKGWIEKDGRLYVSETDGLGGGMITSYDIQITIEGTNCYYLCLYSYMGEELFQETPNEFKLSYENGNWILDIPFAFYSAMPINLRS